MDPDHPPVEVLRLAARAATVLGLYAGAVRVLTSGLPAVLDAMVVVWVLLGAVFVAAAMGSMLRTYEAIGGATLAATAVLATMISGTGAPLFLSSWSEGHVALFFAAGVFHLSAWTWQRHETGRRGDARPTEDAERVEGS